MARKAQPKKPAQSVNPEQLLSAEEAARRFGISRRQFYRLLPELIAKGLEVRTVGQKRKLYRESSIDKLIAAGGEPTAKIV